MSQGAKRYLLWLLLGTLGVLFSLNHMRVDLLGNVLPADNDSFYHARRILDLADFNKFYQFDSKIHAPEGSFLTWPWAYDYFIAKLINMVQLILAKPSATILAFIPTLWFYLQIALVLQIAYCLQLNLWGQLLVGAAFTLLPLNIMLHAPGRVDHHFMELTFVLLSLYTGIKACATHSNKKQKLLFGLVLGMAPAINCGLFVLIIPFMLLVTKNWLERKTLPEDLIMIAASYWLSTLLFLLPSEPFQLQQFSFYLHSWFHLYVASVVLLLIGTYLLLKRNWRSLLLLGLFAIIALLPLYQDLVLGGNFILNRIAALAGTVEMQSPWTSLDLYAYTLLLLPLSLWFIIINYKSQDRGLQYTALFFALGLLLLSRQIRFHYYGSLALILPSIYLLQHYSKCWPTKKTAIYLSCSLMFMLPFIPQFIGKYSLMHGGSALFYEHLIDYYEVYPLFAKIKAQCASDPGIILADPHIGNYLRYHTECSVIANRMLITPQHFAKAFRVDELLTGSRSNFFKAKEPIKYVYVGLRGNWDIKYNPDTDKKELVLQLRQPSAKESLFNDLFYNESKVWGKEFKLLFEEYYRMNDKPQFKLARFFQVKN